MSLVLLALAIALPATATADCCRSGDTGATADGGDAASIGSWVIHVDRDTVAPPAGVSLRSCSRWLPAAMVSGPGATWVDVATFRVDRDGVLAELHYRECGDPVTRQHTWIRHETAESLLEHALGDLRRRLLVAPELRLAPPTRSIVHLETWLAVRDPGTISVTAAVDGLSSTATAQVLETVWHPGDGGELRCRVLGTRWTPSNDPGPAPCGHTYRQVHDDNEIRVRFVWGVTWRSTNGQGGTLPDVDGPTTEQIHPVREVQSVGVRG